MPPRWKSSMCMTPYCNNFIRSSQEFKALGLVHNQRPRTLNKTIRTFELEPNVLLLMEENGTFSSQKIKKYLSEKLRGKFQKWLWRLKKSSRTRHLAN